MPSSDNAALVNDEDDVDQSVPTGCGASLACDPRKNLHRFLMLPLLCLLGFGSYFCYDNPAAMQDTMLNDLSITTSQFSNFYAFYSWPNVVLSVVGGFLIDRVFGIRLGAIIFSSFVLAGQLLFSMGAYLSNKTAALYMMYAARFVFGIGGESLAVAQNTYAISWFPRNELNFIFGLQLSMSRVGSTVNMNVMQPLYDSLKSSLGEKTLGAVLLIAATTCVFSLICCIVLALFDRRAKRILAKGAAETGEKIQLQDLLHFPIALWFLCIICVLYYGAVFPFVSLAQVFYIRKYSMSTSEANALNSILYIVGAAASPVMGFIIDRVGKNVFWLLLGVCSTLGCHAMMAFSFNIPPAFIMATMGVSYATLASSLWPMVAFVVKDNQRATAYGIMQSIQNLGLAVIVMAAGGIVDASGYLILEVFFMMCLCGAMLFTVMLYLWDLSNEGKLNESGASRRRKALEELEKTAISDVDESLAARA